MKKIFELHQNFTLMVNEYKIIKDGKLAAFARQKRLALREHFTLYKDETRKDMLAVSKARTIIDLGPTFDVVDASGKKLGALRKDFKKSLLSSTWYIGGPDKDEPLFSVEEKNYSVAIFRRLWNFVPLISELPFFWKFHFSIMANGKVVGEYRKITSFRDHYALHLDEAQIGKVDERVWMVMAVLLDAMQSR